MDPVMLLLPEPDARPMSFIKLSEEEQAWRGRYFLMAWSAGAPAPMAWMLALSSNLRRSDLVSDEQIAEGVRGRTRVDAPAPVRAARAGRTLTEFADGIMTPRAMVHGQRRADWTWFPIGVWLGTRSHLTYRYRTENPAWLVKAAFIAENANPPFVPADDPFTTSRGTWADWIEWAVDEDHLGNGITDAYRKVKPELTIDALFQREIEGRTPSPWKPQDQLKIASEVPDGLGGYRKRR